MRCFLLACVAIGSIAVACVPSSALVSAKLATILRVTASEFKFASSTPQVAVGESVTIVFENRGTIEHNLHLDATSTHIVAEPGQTVTAVVVFAAAGATTFICTLPGHSAAGMSAALQVGDAQAKRVPTSVAATESKLLPMPADTPRVPQGQLAPPITRREPALVK